MTCPSWAENWWFIWNQKVPANLIYHPHLSIDGCTGKYWQNKPN